MQLNQMKTLSQTEKLQLFLDGLLRILGIIPPFMDLDVNVIDDVIEKVEEDIMPLVQDTAQKVTKYIPGR